MLFGDYSVNFSTVDITFIVLMNSNLNTNVYVQEFSYNW